MMAEFGFVYDSSIIAPFSDPPVWPYTLDYKPPHPCVRAGQLCPTRSYRSIWELPLNQLLAGVSETAVWQKDSVLHFMDKLIETKNRDLISTLVYHAQVTVKLSCLARSKSSFSHTWSHLVSSWIYTYTEKREQSASASFLDRTLEYGSVITRPVM